MRVVYVEVEENIIKNRKPQWGMTVLICVSIMGIVFGIFFQCLLGKKPASAKKKKV